MKNHIFDIFDIMENQSIWTNNLAKPVLVCHSRCCHRLHKKLLMRGNVLEICWTWSDVALTKTLWSFFICRYMLKMDFTLVAFLWPTANLYGTIRYLPYGGAITSPSKKIVFFPQSSMSMWAGIYLSRLLTSTVQILCSHVLLDGAYSTYSYLVWTDKACHTARQ